MAKRRTSTKSRPGGSGETADQLLRKLLKKQLAVVKKNELRARKGSVKGLHDIRVALRRIRTLAMTFEKLEPRFLPRLERRIAKVCDRMGDARDIDVWIGLFQGLGKAGGLEDVPRRDQRAVLKDLRRERTHLAAAALKHDSFRRAKTMLRDYLRQRPPNRRRPLPPEAYAARHMLAVRRQIAKRYRKAGTFLCEPAHDLRRAGRRMRYLCEFYAKQMGPVCVRAGKWITKAQAALGKVHDCDSALELSRDLPSGQSRAAVRRALKKRRAALLRKFKSAWRPYANPRLQMAWEAQLEDLAGED